MRYGSICANNNEPVIYATAYRNNFETVIVIRPGLASVQERFPWHVAFTAVLTFLYVFCMTVVSILSWILVLIHTSAQRFYMNYRCYQIILWVKLFVHELWVLRTVSWIFVTGGASLVETGWIVTL